MRGRTFLTRSAAAVVEAGIARRASGQTAAVGWRSLRLVAGASASSLERIVLDDAAGLFSRAIGTTVPVVAEPAAWGPSDVLVGCPETTRATQPMTLDAPGWFWHDFPDPAWADAVRTLPSEDAAAFEQTMRDRLRRVLASARRRPSIGARSAPSVPSRVGREAVQAFLAQTTSIPLPARLGIDALRPFLDQRGASAQAGAVTRLRAGYGTRTTPSIGWSPKCAAAAPWNVRVILASGTAAFPVSSTTTGDPENGATAPLDVMVAVPVMR